MKLSILLLLTCAATSLGQRPGDPAIVLQEFIYETGPYPSVHASTIVETRSGDLVAAWFGGTRERGRDVGIWVSRKEKSGWTPSVEVANGVQADGTRHPTWNPVLFQPRSGPLMLFYKVGPSPQTWWGMLRTSSDDGRTWSAARRLPDGILGPIKNKPVQLADGTIVAPTSTESDSNPSRWQVHFERTTDGGRTWSATSPLNDGMTMAAIQPSILFREKLGGDRLLAVGRTRQGKVFSTSSDDAGRTWSPLTLIDSLPNPNAGTDALTLADGRHLIVYNPVPSGRTPLAVAVSHDGRAWTRVLTLEDQPGEYSYPAVIQTSDGRVHVTYTWKRQRVKHVVLDLAKLARPVEAQRSPHDTMPAAVVQRFVDAANARDLDGMVATVAPDAVFGALPESGTAATGRDSVRAMYTRVFARTPVGFTVTIASRIADGAFVTDLEHFTNPDGTPAGRATWVYLVREGLIRRAWSLRVPRASGGSP